MIRIRKSMMAPADQTKVPDPHPVTGSTSAYDVAREIVAVLEEHASLALVVEVEDEDGEPEVSGAEFSSDGIAIIERALQAALRRGGIRP